MNRIYGVLAVVVGLFFLGMTVPRPIPSIFPHPVILTRLDTVTPTATVRPYVRLNRVTAYNPVANQTDSTPDVSSCGPNKPNQIAVSRDLFLATGNKQDMCGKVVTLVLDNGKVLPNVVIWDTMNPRYRKTADIFLHTTNVRAAMEFGVQKGYLVF